MGFGNVWFVTLFYTVQAGSVHVSNRIQSTAGVCWGGDVRRPIIGSCESVECFGDLSSELHPRKRSLFKR